MSFTCFILTSLIAMPLGEYFLSQLRKAAPESFGAEGIPRAGSLTLRSPPDLRYLNFILGRRYVSILAYVPRLRRLAEALFWLHSSQFIALVAALLPAPYKP